MKNPFKPAGIGAKGRNLAGVKNVRGERAVKYPYWTRRDVSKDVLLSVIRRKKGIWVEGRKKKPTKVVGPRPDLILWPGQDDLDIDPFCGGVVVENSCGP